MEANKQLSIVIPTYNRADFLDYSLEVHIPLVSQYNIEICIFDNASTDNTKEVVSKWMKEYPYLSYHKNETNIGPDANFERALKYPVSDYVWLLGDSSLIEKKVFEKVLFESGNVYDLILINDTSRVKDIESGIVTDKNILLLNLGWHMSQMSSLIYNKMIIMDAKFTRYQNTNFIQTGIIFEYLATKNSINICWCKEYSIQNIAKDGLKKNSWEAQTFEIWIRKWSNFILSLPPQYTIEEKLATIAMHNKKTKLFSIKKLLLLRSKNFYNFNIFMTYNTLFHIALKKYSYIIFLIITIIPVGILDNLIKFNKSKIKR